MVEDQPAPMEEEQAAPEEDSDEEDSDNWSPATTDEDQELMLARGPVQAALVASFEQHRGLSVEEINAALTISLQRHELEERARVTMEEEREALRQFYQETAEGRLAREATEAAEAAVAAEAVAAAEAEDEAARNARMSMDRLRRRTVTAERHHQMVAARQRSEERRVGKECRL